MNKIMNCLIAAGVALVPGIASAGAQYATVDTAYASEEGIISATLHAVAQQEPVDGNYVFTGFVVQTSGGGPVPWTVTVPAEMPSPPSTVMMNFAQGDIVELHSFAFKAGEVAVEKSLYYVKGEEAGGVLMITDDPLPIVAWLVIGGASSIIIPIGIYVTQCRHIATKTTFTVDGTATFETSCER